MNYDIKAGFSRVNITSPLGIEISGYYVKRIADGVLDELEINTLAVSKDDSTVLLMSVDTLGINAAFINSMKELITAATGIPAEAIFIHATHTHTAGKLPNRNAITSELETDYMQMVRRAGVNAAVLAINDLKPAKMGYAVSEAKNIAFNRRYLMKDGSTRTNPGVNNPDIVRSIGLLDERVNVLRFLREDGTSLVLINFGNHPDTVGGTKLSCDWPGFTRRIFERAIDNTKCIFFNGAQGDINHVNVFPKGGDLNDMFIDFDDVSRGYGHARHCGNVVAAAAMQVYDKVCYTDVDCVKAVIRTVDVPSNKPLPEEMPEARHIHQMHLDGRDAELPYQGMMLTTMVADAARKMRLENGPDSFPLPLGAIRIGNVALFGIPGEPFTGIGLGLKEAEGWDMVLPCCCTNGYSGYFPMKDSYDEGGYEAKSSPFKSGTAEMLIKEGTAILDDLRS